MVGKIILSDVLVCPYNIFLRKNVKALLLSSSARHPTDLSFTNSLRGNIVEVLAVAEKFPE